MSRKQYADQDFQDVSRILNLPAPTSANEPARKADLDAAVEGLAWKDSCRVATQSNVNLASPGAAIDGITMASGDRVLVKVQTAGAENGIYLWNGDAISMTRAADASTAPELEQAVVSVEEGSDAGSTWRQTVVNFVLDTGTVTWGSFVTSAPAASETVAGIAELATQAETDAGTDDARIVTPLKLATHAGRKLKLVQAFGDGAATQYDITHNWGTRDVHVELVRTAAPYDTVSADITRPDINTVRINTTIAPTSNQFTAVLIA